MDLDNDMPEERSNRMAEQFDESAAETYRAAQQATDPTERQKLMDQYHRLVAASSAWNERYALTTGRAR